MVEEQVIDLNALSFSGAIICPYCHKGKVYSYGASGRSSQTCSVCRNIMLCDYDSMVAYRAGVKKIYNMPLSI